MTTTPDNATFDSIARAIRPLAFRHGWYFVLPIVLCLFTAALYIVAGSKSYRASQSLAVRDDLLGESFKPGRYTSLESLKNAQEIISHLARRPAVIRAAWRNAFPEKANNPHWPSDDQIEQIQNQISVIGSNGAELGKTEVIVLTVRQAKRATAKTAVEQLAAEVERHLRELRINQLRSMRNEQEQVVTTLERGLDQFHHQLQEFESSLGADLGTLRSLLENSSGQNELLRALESIRTEKRNAEHDWERIAKQQSLLRELHDDPLATTALSGELLNAHPTLKRLFDGLAEWQIKASAERGRYTDRHSAVQAAEQALVEVHRQLMTEAGRVQQYLTNQRQLVEQNLQRLQRAEAAYESKLAQIGRHRVEYQSLVSELTKRSEALAKARHYLLELRSLTEPTTELSLLTPVGAAQADTRPQGPSKSMLLLSALLGGLAIGGGLVALRIEPDELAVLRHIIATPVRGVLGSRSPAGNAPKPPPPRTASKVQPKRSTTVPDEDIQQVEVAPPARVIKPVTLRPAKLVQSLESGQQTPEPNPAGTTPAPLEAARTAESTSGTAKGTSAMPRSPQEKSQSSGPAPHNSSSSAEQSRGPVPSSAAPPVTTQTTSSPADLAHVRAQLENMISTADAIDIAGVKLQGGDPSSSPVPLPGASSVDAYCPTIKRVARRNKEQSS